ncbi:MAG: sigma-70 family RNA polymerase sigma factor [Hamadaea sp.]|nr:sigma-70 family RNA polymerase sigma factor [Hamadaea sp.]
MRRATMSPVLADTTQVVAARDGDRQALAELLTGHLPLVYNIVGRALDGHPDVDDVVQETMLRAVQGLHGLREPESFRSWLVAIAVRQIRERERSRRTPYRLDIWQEADDQPDPEADFVDDAITRARLAGHRNAVREATRWLDGEDRRVLALWWQELLGGLSRADIAATLGITVAHTGVRIQRMRAHLDRARLILAAWRATPRCAGLQSAAQGWDGRADSRWVKRLHRHVRDCPQCVVAGRLAPDEVALAQIGLLPIAGGLATAITQAASGPIAPAGLLARVWQLLTAKPAATITAGATAAAAVTAAIVLLPSPTPEDPPTANPPIAGSAPTVSTAPSSVPPSPTSTPSAATGQIYLAPGGDDDGDGTQAHPYATLAKAVSVVRPGQTIIVRGGTYRPAESVEIATNGTAQKRITLTSAAGEHPVFDATAVPHTDWFVTQRAAYWTIRGLEIRNAPTHAYVCVGCRSVVFTGVSFHDNNGTGLMLRGDGTTGNQVLDSDFYRNHDTGAAADGLAFKYGSGTGNTVRGCRFWSNVDDGFDLHEFTSPVTVDRSWAYANGRDLWHDATQAVIGSGNGFRLGGGDPAPAVAHVVTNSAAWDNAGYGFTESANRGGLRLSHNTAYRNAKDGFAFFYSAAQFSHNLALANNRDAVLADAAVEDANSWNQSGWTTSTLRQSDPRTAQGPRRADGKLPATDFLTNTRDPAIGAPMRTS